MKKKLFSMLILFTIGLQCVLAQNREISGVVTSADDGLSVPGVSVIVKGTTIGTSTDFDGKYTISVPADGKILIFSSVGMKKVEVAITSNIINMIMESESVGMDEVVVLGYVTRKKNELTGSSVQISGNDLTDVPMPSIDQALQGKVAGVTITGGSGTPGSVQDIRIRGVSSITASNEPLYVIDGVPMINGDMSGYGKYASTTSMLSTINISNIQSMTVLKDASATAAYGARGSNGVIVITTKAGKAGKTKFNFNTTYGISNEAVDGVKMISAKQYDELYREIKGGKSSWDGKTDSNWGNLIKNKDAVQQTYDLSTRGGNDKNSFFVSAGWSKNESIIIGSDFERMTGQVNLDSKLTDKLKFSTKNSGSSVSQNGFLEQSAYFSNPIAAKYFMPAYRQSYDKDGNPALTGGGNYNPLYTTIHNIDKNVITRISSNNSLSYDITPNLVFKTNYTVDYTIADYTKFNDRKYGDGSETSGSIYRRNRNNFNWVTQNSLNYKYSINDHRFNISAIQEFQKNKYNDLGAEGEKLPADGLYTLNSVSKPLTTEGSYEDWMIASYLSLVNYSFSNRYYLDATYRKEGSSKFSSDERWGNFWSIGGAWNAKNESFLKDVKYLSSLRLRASYGVNGSHGVDPNKFQALLEYDSNYNEQGGSYPSQFGNSNLTWEKNKIMDFGLEFGFFDNRITGSAGYYNRKTYDLLLKVPMSYTAGHKEQIQNVGEMTNKGIEFELNGDIVATNDFKWNLGFNFSTVKNEVTKLAKDAKGNDLNIETSTRKVEVGREVYAWNMRKYAGVDPKTGNPLWFKNGKDGETTNNYSSAKKAYQGANSTPTFSGSINTHLEYKGIYLDASLYFAGGHKVFESWARYTNGAASIFQGMTVVDKLMNRWQKPGDITDIPRLGTDGAVSNAASTSTRFLYDGDYVRLKNLTLGYNFSENLCNKIGFNGIRAYVKGGNLLTWVKDKGLERDPETAADGFMGMTAPISKTITFGLNLNF